MLAHDGEGLVVTNSMQNHVPEKQEWHEYKVIDFHSVCILSPELP